MKILVLHQFYTRFDEPGVSRFNIFAKYWKEERYSTTVIAGGWRSALAGLFISRPSFIIASSPPLLQGLLGYALSRIRRVPFVLDVPRLSPDEPASARCRLRRFLYSRARNVVVSSPGFKQFLVARGEVSEEKVGVVPNPIEFESMRSAAREGFSLRARFSWDKKCVVLCGSLCNAMYDFDTLLDIAREIQAEDKYNIHFVLVGDGPRKSRMIRRMKTDNIRNVEFLPPVPRDQIVGYISAADICVASLRREALLRYVYTAEVLDYMALKRPVVVAGEGVMADLVSKYAKCGISVPPGDKDRMKVAILQLAKNKSRRSLLGEQGYIFAKEHFSAPALAKRYLEYLYPSTSSGLRDVTFRDIS